ncbi:hypothetical protein N7481_003987 [Penicillium waksmanii]|uniref:uncharacterized protein n=1 Tax=Penicillium waksmanii TaxID=69791 RepID=UPI002547F4D9|nr:uncharacterized protein N7481_003987 [Penicillium waksmanii]KAJ5988777.1 hypothetical protein N7481_003987 [Penicillium waksmanii]
MIGGAQPHLTSQSRPPHLHLKGSPPAPTSFTVVNYPSSSSPLRTCRSASADDLPIGCGCDADAELDSAAAILVDVIVLLMLELEAPVASFI